MVAELAKPANVIDTIQIQALAAELQGEIVLPGDEQYDVVRAIWNARHNRRPALIVRADSTADVQAVVRFASETGLPLSIRSGGHGVTGAAVAQDSLMLDLSTMKSIEVDPEARIARADAGLTWREYAAVVGAHGLATPSGKLPGAGLGGLTLGGGIGWLVRKHGLTIDHLLSAEVVLASGDVVTASETENADLFWGIRGGSGNLGIVTRFTFRLLPVATIYGGIVAYPLPAAGDVLRYYREFIKTAPEELTTVAALMTHPQAGKMVAVAACYTGSVEAGEKALTPLVNFGTPAMVQLAEMPYGTMLSLLADAAPAGFNRIQRSSFVERFGDGLIDRLVDAYASSTSPHNVILIEHYGGAMSRVASEATAFPHRHRELNLLIDMGWAPGEDSAIGKGWGEALWSTVQPYLSGSAYVNFLDDEGEARVKAAYGAANYLRLKELKRKYDPANLFNHNHNVADKSKRP